MLMHDSADSSEDLEDDKSKVETDLHLTRQKDMAQVKSSNL